MVLYAEILPSSVSATTVGSLVQALDEAAMLGLGARVQEEHKLCRAEWPGYR